MRKESHFLSPPLPLTPNPSLWSSSLTPPISQSCYTTPGGPAPTADPTTTTKPTTGGSGPTPTGVTTTLPASSGAVSSSAPVTVKAGQTFDGGMKKYDRSREYTFLSLLVTA